jgi:hypothetical protein
VVLATLSRRCRREENRVAVGAKGRNEALRGRRGQVLGNLQALHEIEAATDKLHYDFFYIKCFSPWLDALIVAKTAWILLTGHGAR